MNANEKKLIIAARTMSLILSPFYLPIMGMIALFLFSYLKMLPMVYKLQFLFATYIFTVLMPTMLIHYYRRYQGWPVFALVNRERRMIPYVISIISYLTCFYLMQKIHLPHFMTSIIVTALILQVVCAIINISWKISTHTAGVGAFTGGLIAYSLIFNFNPVWWLSLLILLGGMVGSARMILRIHTLSQVVGGYLIGMLTAFIVIILI